MSSIKSRLHIGLIVLLGVISVVSCGKPVPPQQKTSKQNVERRSFEIPQLPDTSILRVVGISDGDTFTGLTSDTVQVKVRLNGIDTPEKRQAYGQKAKDLLSEYIAGKYVIVVKRSHDRYGRIIATIYTDDGTDICLKLLEAGLAWHYKQFDDNPVYSEAEKRARSAKVGLWADKDPVAPWDFRHNKK